MSIDLHIAPAAAGRIFRPAAARALFLGSLVLIGCAQALLPPGVEVLARNAEGVVLQQRSQSCGPAAVATILTYFYGLPVSENDVVEPNGKDAPSSMTDLAKALRIDGTPALIFPDGRMVPGAISKEQIELHLASVK